MKRFDLRTLTELVGIVAIVASLIFVGLQMRQTQDIALSARAETRAANAIEFANVINEHPEIWAKGLSGARLDEIDAIVFGNQMQAQNDLHYFASEAGRQLGFESAWNYYAIVYGVFLYRNPGARQWYEAHQSAQDEVVRLANGSVVLNDWHDRVKAVWTEIERTVGLESRAE